MKPPIFVDENGSISMFSTAFDALLELEPIDVMNNEYLVFDSEGRQLTLAVSDSKVILASIEREPDHAEVLETKLRDFLAATGCSKRGIFSADLEELVSQFCESCKK